MPKDYPDQTRVEVGIVGRSNAGKSSLVNVILNKKIARISQVPGKTIVLNFYDVGSHYRLVDMPGYGFAKRSFKDRESWKEMIETYLANRENLRGLVLVVDVNRNWQQEEQDLANWCEKFDIPMLVALSRSDRLKQGEKHKRLDYFLKASTLPCFLISSTKKKGIKELEDYIFNEWVKA